MSGREVVAIVGAQGLGLELAIQLRNGGISVIFLDANPWNCRRAEELGFQVIYGDALQERALQRARFENGRQCNWSDTEPDVEQSFRKPRP